MNYRNRLSLMTQTSSSSKRLIVANVKQVGGNPVSKVANVLETRVKRESYVVHVVRIDPKG